jgi:tRNA1Val (adenine37-N6)-methyltransferase
VVDYFPNFYLAGRLLSLFINCFMGKAKANAVFHFKKFSVRHDRCVHKVGTDGVLLGAWADVEGAANGLDIGTGSAVIALMTAQRTPPVFRMDAIEISTPDYQQARENVMNSPWPDKVNVMHTSLQGFTGGPYDLIISNPPFFTNSLKPPRADRGIARHTESLTSEDLLKHAARLMKPDGALHVIFPFAEGNRFLELAAGHRWYCTRLCTFYSRAHKPPERLLLTLKRTAGKLKTEKLVLYEQGDEWSAGYRQLTGAFYLNS